MPRPDTTRRRLMLAGAAGLLGTSALSACSPPGSKYHATDISGSDIGRNWRLPDTTGAERTAKDYTGKVAAVFFGFIQCPDVCPTTLAELAQVRQELGDDADRLQVLFITVDPERDTPEIVEQYVTQFDPSFVGLRGDTEQLAAAARAFKVFYAKVPTQDGSNYTMDHSAGLYLFGPDGDVQLYARYGQPVPELTSDIRGLMG